MAVLSKIRQRSLLLILVIGFCLLAFVVGDVLNSGGFQSTPRDVGSVNGDEIAYDDFRTKVDNVEKSGQGITSSQAVSRVWEQEVTISLMNAEFDKLGLRVSEAQVMDVLKQSQDIGQNPSFLNEAGIFDNAKFSAFFNENPALKQQLTARIKEATLNAKFQMYSALVKAGTFTTTAEAKMQYEMGANKVTLDFVAVPYSSIKDSDVKVSDDEIVAFMRKNQKKYKAEETRELQMVMIEEKASIEDEAQVKAELMQLLNGKVEYVKETQKNDTVKGFRTTKNTAEFVNMNSDVSYDSSYVAKKDLPADVAEQLYNLPQGEIYGPYRFNDYLALSKSMGRESGVNAKASHILISYTGAMRANPAVTRTKEEAQLKANEILAQVQANPASFAMLAQVNSDDSSKQQGGDLGFFSKGQMTGKFNDFVFNNSIGKIGLVETEFGFHIINVTDKQDGIRLATIARKIEASESTADKVYNQAVTFEMDANEKDFAAVAKASGLTVIPGIKLSAMDENIGGIQSQRQIVKWAFDKKTSVGDVKRYEVPNLGNVIVKLVKVNEEGLMAIDQARPMIENRLKNQKKVELIKAKLKGTTLDAMAQSAGVTVQNAVDVSIENAVLPGFGQEQRAVATAFALAPNKVSAPIEGASAVFVVMQKSVAKAPAITDYSPYLAVLQGQNAAAPGRVITALKENADIKDNRPVFY
ncbi:peptidylprolyl isomerase [Flavobacterium tegetincola]|uniref:peptidylprolyl isomerase n=1 Tax=Flavobacterium tegetincola TaxID=150172 RepID=UPI00040F4EAC|nr:peptidylprolyl isomerase [Flavobacterium tegetincola]